MHRSLFLRGCLTASLALPLVAMAESPTLETVTVTATLRPQALIDVPTSVTVLDTQTLKDAGQQHFEDVLGLIPNLNWAAGSSRPRYFQIRGIGEREQYEGAPNPSVGFLIDDIDFSGVGMPATLFDVQQIEVLRGPQGTRYGANALAGLISVRGNDPENSPQAGVEASVGDYQTRSLGAYATGPVESLNSAWRVSLQQYRSDGFRSNPYLHRKDTDGRDELSGRFKWHWQADNAQVDFTLLHANLDNGYDAFSIDNTRVSLSDKPGKDAQRSTGASLKWQNTFANSVQFTAIGSVARSHILNSYDGDWGNTQSWQELMRLWSARHGVPGNAWQRFVYDYVYKAERDRDTRSIDLRLASTHTDQLNWLVGVYTLNLREHIRELSQGDYQDPVAYDYFSATDDFLDSRYDATNTALYGQLDGRFATRWSWSLGLREERRSADYHDSRLSFNADDGSLRTRQSENMWGGQASLGLDLSDDDRLYASVSRGYKAGGFNLGFAAQARPRFTEETLNSYELGVKGRALHGRLYFDTALFYEQRHNMQVLDSKQLVDGDPNSFVFFTDNVGAGYNTGLESSVRMSVSQSLEAGGTVGLLRTHTRPYMLSDGTLVAGREQAHAPEYTASIYAQWRQSTGLMARVEVVAKDNFYFSNAPSTLQSNAYTLTNIKLGYERTSWSAYAWVRNVFDKDYATRGFEFGNEPPDFNNALYIQHGDPRQVGVTTEYKF